MESNAEKMSWGIERRLEFLEFRLYWEGKVNRSDLVDYFGISIPQASADIGRYQQLAPQNMVYDTRLKSYITGPAFKPIKLHPDAQSYFTQLRFVAEGILPRDKTALGWVPPFEAVPTIVRRVDAQKLKLILESIRARNAVKVEYQSLSRPDPLWRWLTPHALAYDGSRWHIRAWCHTRKNFQDFVLARMIAIGESMPHKIDSSRDVQWNELVAMRIGPHPRLGDAARKAIELDYGMENGELAITTRICLSFYLEKHLNLDIDPDSVRPERVQIVLLNRTEVEDARKQADERHAAALKKENDETG